MLWGHGDTHVLSPRNFFYETVGSRNPANTDVYPRLKLQAFLFEFRRSPSSGFGMPWGTSHGDGTVKSRLLNTAVGVFI